VARQRRNGLVADWVYRGQRWLQSDPTTGEANPSGSYGVTIPLTGHAEPGHGQRASWSPETMSLHVSVQRRI